MSGSKGQIQTKRQRGFLDCVPTPINSPELPFPFGPFPNREEGYEKKIKSRLLYKNQEKKNNELTINISEKIPALV